MTAPHELPPTRHALPKLAAAIPVLKTKRLTLRAPSLADFDTLLQIDDSVAETSLRGARDREASFADFAQFTATWIWRGHGWWTVDDVDGPCGFVGIGFEFGDQAPELGYILTPGTRGKGYATEACIAARDWVWASGAIDVMVSYISDSNAASQNVARKLGATRDAKLEVALGEDAVQVWRHPRPKSGDAA